jgi:N-acetylglucosamine-6-phosphate deacetylase
VNTLSGRLLIPHGLQTGSLTFSDTIQTLSPGRGQGPYILPGFIDSHVHGGGGGDVVDGAAGVRTLARFHLGHGTTTLYPTTITKPWEEILRVLGEARALMDEAIGEAGPSLPGVHLEGPFISPDRLGAQPPFALEPTPALVDEVLAFGVVRLVTLAPEVPGALEAAKRFARAGVRVSVGHSTATYRETLRVLAAVEAVGGTAGFTHFGNAMGGMTARDPGVMGAALAQRSSFAELILDGHHVHDGTFLAAYNAKPQGLTLITDAIRAAGMAEGGSELAGREVTVQGGTARLADGTLAGSLLTLDGALRNAVAAGLSLEGASRLLSANPARYLGLGDRGELSVGKRADLVVLDDELRVLEVYVGGRRLIG